MLELLGSDMDACTVYAKVRLGNADIKMRSPSRTFLYNGTQVLLFHASGKHALSKAQSTGSEGKALARLFA